MIVYPHGIDTVKTGDVLYGRKQAVRNMVIQMLVDAAESHVDMLLDCPEEYPTKKDVEAVFQNLNEIAESMFEDYFHDLREAVFKELKEIKIRARVTRMDYANETGELKDITVNISVE